METQCVYCELGNELVYELEAFTGLQYWLFVRSIITSGSTEKQCNVPARINCGASLTATVRPYRDMQFACVLPFTGLLFKARVSSLEAISKGRHHYADFIEKLVKVNSYI